MRGTEMKKMREEFEDWFCSTIPYKIAKESWFAVMNDGCYIITDVQAAWAGWKASRAALCVELPSFENGSIRGYSGDCDEARMVVDSVAESPDKAGVSYK